MRSKVKDSDIASLIVMGKNNSEIARALHVDRKRVAKVREMTATTALSTQSGPVPIDTVRAVVRLEMSQEETLNEFSDQLGEYTTNYRKAMDREDETMAGKWAVLRMQLLDRMITISGLQQRSSLKEVSAQDVLSSMTDEEVESRARQILAKRQR